MSVGINEKTFLNFENPQIEFANAVFSAKHKYYLWGGDIRSGKTVGVLGTAVCLFKIFPGSKWCAVRNDLPTLKRTTMESFLKYACPQGFIKDFNKTELKFTFQNDSVLQFMSAQDDRDPDLNRFKGLEVNGFIFDQIEEINRLVFDIATTRIGQWRIDPMPPEIILATTNPTNNWVKTLWYDRWNDGTLPKDYYFQPARIRDNPYITENYINTLKENLPPELFKRYLSGSWDAVDDVFQLVPWVAINKAKNRVNLNYPICMGADIGRDGKDPSIWIIGDSNIKEIVKISQTKTYEVEEKTKELIDKYQIDPNNVCLDAVGIGAGVCDHLQNDGYDIIPFVGGSAVPAQYDNYGFNFYNLRSFASWMAAREIKNNRIGNIVDAVLKSEIGGIKYGIKNDKMIYIESKEEFKKKYKKSSDHWDAFYYFMFARLKAEIGFDPGFMTI